VNHIEEVDSPSRFVCLKMSNQMPPRALASDFIDLLLPLLDAVLPNVSCSKLYYLTHNSRWMSLCDGDKRDVVRGPARPIRSGCDLDTNVRKSFCQCRFSRVNVCHNQIDRES
jgi:hypothetical protein